MRYLHTMIRVADADQTVKFFTELLGFKEVHRSDSEKGRYTNIFLAGPDDELAGPGSRKSPLLELTYNWPPEKGEPEIYTGGRNFGHLAYEVDDIYALCAKLQAAGVTINRPPRDGNMAFVKTPDGISIELLQKGDPLPAQEPWSSAPNIGSW